MTDKLNLPRITPEDIQANCMVARQYMTNAGPGTYGDDFSSQQLQAAIDTLQRIKGRLDAQIYLDALKAKECQ